jgi:SH3-like domain-containing protein
MGWQGWFVVLFFSGIVVAILWAASLHARAAGSSRILGGAIAAGVLVAIVGSGLLFGRACARQTAEERALQAAAKVAPAEEGLLLAEVNYAVREGINVRGGPGEDHPVVRKLGAGEAVQVVASTGGTWKQLGELTGAGGLARPLNEWVHATLLTAERPPTKEELEARSRLEAAQLEAGEEARRAYGPTLRERFLDAGLDIKVRVSGRDAERLELTYVLFSDVWTHRMQKDGLVSQWRDMGFARVDVKDGFDYHTYWTFR